MTPRKAIEVQCRYCKSGQRFDCESTSCNLNDRRLSPLKRIRGHCHDCVGSRAEVVSCQGNILNPSPHKCSLWDYRLGTNPALRGRKGNVDHLRPFMKKVAPSDSGFLP